MSIKFAPNDNLDGQVISTKVTQNTRVVENNVDNWKNARTAPEVSLTMYRPCRNSYAPELICVEVTGWLGFDARAPEDIETYDYRRHDISYEWTITDQDGNPPPAFTATRLMAHQRDASKSYEWMTARVLGVGTWTFSVTVEEGSSGKTATASVTATVADILTAPYEVFAIDPNSVWDGAPVGATLVTSFEDTFDNWSVFGQGGNGGVFLLPKGQTYVYSRATPLIDNNRNVYFGSYGPGTGKPVVQGFRDLERNQGAFQSLSDVRVQGIRFESTWDAVTETGSGGSCFNLGALGVCTLVVDDCEFIDWGVAFFNVGGGANDFGKAEGASTGVNNTVVTGFKDFGVYCHASQVKNTDSIICYTGCEIKANPLANVGGPKDAPDPFNTHGPIRIPSIDMLVTEGCDLFSCMTWFGNAFPQPCMRIFTNQDNLEGEDLRAAVSRNVMEGGYPILQVRRRNDAATSYPKNVALTYNYFLGSYISREFMSATFSGVRLENNILLATRKGVAGPEAVFGLVEPTEVTIPANTTMFENPVCVARNNTIVDLRDFNAGGSNLQYLFDPAIVALEEVEVEDSNNIIFAPNRTDIDFGDWTPIDTATLAFAPLFARWGTDNAVLDNPSIPEYEGHSTFEVPNVETAAADVIIPRPQTGSALIGAGTGYQPKRDFFLTVRSASFAKGAIEPV